jgi:hypothetical protein
MTQLEPIALMEANGRDRYYLSRLGTSFAMRMLRKLLMQSMLQLNPPIPMRTPRGEGLAVMVIDYGPDFDLWWTVIVSKGEHAGEIWTYPNPQVRGVENISLGRTPMAGGEQRGQNGNGHRSAGIGNGNGHGGKT